MGQLVPFPTKRSSIQRCCRSALSARLIPLIPPSRLYVAGMAAQCPTFKVLTESLNDYGDPLRPAQERVLERLILVMPELPHAPDPQALARLLNEPFRQVCALAEVQIVRSRRDRRHYALCQSVWQDIEDLRLRQFAQRCSVLLTEALYLAHQEGRTNIMAETA